MFGNKLVRACYSSMVYTVLYAMSTTLIEHERQHDLLLCIVLLNASSPLYDATDESYTLHT